VCGKSPEECSIAIRRYGGDKDLALESLLRSPEEKIPDIPMVSGRLRRPFLELMKFFGGAQVPIEIPHPPDNNLPLDLAKIKMQQVIDRFFVGDRKSSYPYKQCPFARVP
jgi:hypothetical protein